MKISAFDQKSVTMPLGREQLLSSSELPVQTQEGDHGTPM